MVRANLDGPMTRFAIAFCVIGLLLGGARAALAGPFEVKDTGWEGCSLSGFLTTGANYTAIKNAIRYSIAHDAASVDFWEICNENNSITLAFASAIHPDSLQVLTIDRTDRVQSVAPTRRQSRADPVRADPMSPRF